MQDGCNSADVSRWTCPAVLRSLAPLRSRVSEAAFRHGYDRDDVGLAITEAVTNVIRHAYPPEHPGPVEVTVDARRERLLLIVEDHGVGRDGFRPRSDLRHGGMGLRLIHALAESASVVTSPTGTRVEMTFRRL